MGAYLKDLTITHEYLKALFRQSKNGPAAETRTNRQKLVTAFKTGIDEATTMGCWALDMLKELDTLTDERTGNSRVCPGEVQPYLNKALAKARADEAARSRSTPQMLQVTEA
jgi:hypothetical protein